MAKQTNKQQRRQGTGHAWLRRALLVLGLAGVAALAVVGWRWQASLPVRAVAVSGVVHADTAAVRDLAAVPDSARLFALDPAILEDRLRRHPWVAEARVTRWMTGTLALDVTERVPTALVLDGAGRPSYFFDAAGFMMPVVAGARYNVPLLQGDFGTYQPTQPVEDSAVRDLLAVLATVPPATDALLSSVERAADGAFVLHTAPAPGPDGASNGSIPVALGHTGFAEKLGRLHAFWEQAVLPRPDTPIRRIDLRFDGQIVTQE